MQDFGKFKKSYDIITNKAEGMYWEIKREHNITPEELLKGKWKEKKKVYHSCESNCRS